MVVGSYHISLSNDNNNDNDRDIQCVYMYVYTLWNSAKREESGLLMLLLLLVLHCMTCVLMTYMAGALYIKSVTGDVSIMSGSTFTGNGASEGGMFL